MANIGAALFEILDADATLGTLLGDSGSTSGMTKIYPGIAPQNETAPFITYQRISTPPDLCKEGLKVLNHRYQVNVWDDNPDDTSTLADRVRVVLQDAAGTYATAKIQCINFDGDQDDVETSLDPPLFGRMLDFIIRETL